MNDTMPPATSRARAMPSAMAAVVSRVMAFLPAGGNLTHAEFKRRHRVIVYLIWVQAAGTLLFGLANHVYAPIVVAETLLIAALGGLAFIEVLAPRFRSAIATLALITTSSVIVQLSGGVTEAHFHFFVMLAVIALYQDWIPFLLAILYVAVDHGVVGTLFPHSVYSNPDAIAHPWQWALIHAAFVLGEAVALLAGWKIIETAERRLQESHDKLETLISNSPVIVFSTDSEGTLLQIQGNGVSALAENLGRDTLVGMNLLELVHRNTELTAVFQRALAGEKVHEVVAVRNWMSDVDSPEPVHLDVLLNPTRDSSGRLISVAGLAVNVSDRMDAASARAESIQKSAFLAAMSHELRTPLNSIMGFSQLLDLPPSNAALTPKQRRYLGHIHSSGEHLLALVSDILDLAKVGAGQMEINLEPVAVHDEVQDPVDKMRPLAAEKGLKIEMEIPLELTSFTDRLRVRQILLNLLANAVKFTARDGGPILVTGRKRGDGIEIAVADSGIGIALNEQARIFEEFTQVDRGPSRRLDGTGLGLALTKKMVAIVGGSIRVDSRLGYGSTFTVWLPGVAASSDSLQLEVPAVPSGI
jgi:signal transduction histidine kinase